jgi:MFS family permease
METTPLLPTQYGRDRRLIGWGAFHPGKPLLKWIILGLVCMTVIGSYYSYDSISVIVDDLMEELELTNAEFGLLYSAYSVPNVVVPFFGGILLDRIGVRMGLLICLYLVAMGTGIVAMAPHFENSFVIMLLGRFIFGLGAESAYVAHDTFCLIWFKGKALALAMGFTTAAGGFSEIITFNTMADINNSLGLRMSLAFSFFVCFFALTVGLILCTVDNAAEEKMRRDGLRRIKPVDEAAKSLNFRAILHFPLGFWLLCIIIMTFYATLYPSMSFAVDFMNIRLGYDNEYASRLVSVMSFISMVMSPTMGFILDKIGKRIYAINIGNVLLIIACFIMGYTDYPIIALVIMGFANSLVPAAMWPSLSILIDDEYFSTAYGLASALGNLALVPTYWMIGYFVDETHEIEKSTNTLAVFSVVGVIVGIIWNVVDYKTGSPCNTPGNPDEDHEATEELTKEPWNN